MGLVEYKKKSEVRRDYSYGDIVQVNGEFNFMDGKDLAGIILVVLSSDEEGVLSICVIPNDEWGINWMKIHVPYHRLEFIGKIISDLDPGVKMVIEDLDDNIFRM